MRHVLQMENLSECPDAQINFPGFGVGRSRHPSEASWHLCLEIESSPFQSQSVPGKKVYIKAGW